ncbi:MAG: hypothetical protein WCK03_02585 [Candidatus Taylorbacteria bacterium]
MKNNKNYKNYMTSIVILFIILITLIVPNETKAATSCYTFTRNLSVGGALTSGEATALQGILTDAGLWNTGLRISSYNQTVANAISAFQENYSSEILIPNNLTSGTGYFGPSTRLKMNSLYGCTSANTVASGSATNTGTAAFVCPSNMTCTPITPIASSFVCPPGYNCTPKAAPTAYSPGSFTLTYLTGSGSANSAQQSAGTQAQAYSQGIGGTASTSNAANDPNVIDAATASALEMASADISNSEAAIIPVASTVAIAGTYPITVNYSQTFEDMLTAFKPISFSDTVGLELFPNNGSGQKNLVAKVFTLGDLFPNVVGTMTDTLGHAVDPLTLGTCRLKACPINVNISYEQFTSTLKTKGYRPVTLQELIALSTKYPQISGVAYGSIARIALPSNRSEVNAEANQPRTGSLVVPYVTGAKEIRESGGTGNDGNTFKIVMLNNQIVDVKSAQIIAVEDSSWTPSSLQSIITSPINFNIAYLPGYRISIANYVIPSIKYSVQIGGKQEIMKLLTVRPPTYASGRTYVGSDNTETIKSLVPAGYRYATTDEMVALNTQYPNARAVSLDSRSGYVPLMGLMALGSPLTSCGGIPMIHSEGFAQINAGGIKNEVDERRLGYKGIPTKIFIFPIVKI